MNSILKIKIIFLFAFFACLITRSQTRVLDVPTHTSPSGSNWCWAGCTTMATQYYGNNTSECEIVEWVRVHIPLPNRGYNDCCVTPTVCYGGLAVSDLDIVLGSENLNCSEINNVVTLSTVQTTINDNRPLIIQGHHNPDGGWHTMIITGYDGSLLHYNDPAGGSYITSYNDAITYDCMGMFSWRWQEHTHIITSIPCPFDLNLTQDIDANADISAQNNIVLSCEIGTNRSVILTAGNSITFNSGFVIPVGSTVEANVVTNPCQ